MKTLIISLISLLLFGPHLANAQTDTSGSRAQVRSGATVMKNADTTIIDIKGLRIVIRESENGKMDVRVARGDEDMLDLSIDPDSIDSEEEWEAFEEELEREMEALEEELEQLEELNDFKDKEARVEIGSVEVDECDELDNVKTRFGLLEIGVNGYINDNSLATPVGYPGLELNYGKSINVNLHLLRQRVNLIAHHVNLMYGIGFEFNDYRFANPVTLEPGQPELTFVDIEEPIKKTKLATTYLNVPVMLNFETNPEELKRSFHLNAGMYGGVLLGSRIKYKTTDNNKVKQRGDFNVNTLRYGVTGSIGYGWFTLYANYGLSELFANNEGPVVQPFSIGLTVIGF